MRTSLTFGSIQGIPLQIHINWVFIALLVTWSLVAGYFPQEYPGWSSLTYWIVGLATALLFFGSVLLHEIGHAIVALREGVPVNSITLFIFGGIARIAHEPETAGSEFRIVIAGPLASLSLALLFSLLGIAMRFNPPISSAMIYLSKINTILALFNMLPGFPLDGGRILRSILWRWKGDFLRATRWATKTGLIVAILFMAGGLFLVLSRDFFNGLWVAFIGWYLSSASHASYRQAVSEDVGQNPGPMLPEFESRLTLQKSSSQNAADVTIPTGVYGTTFIPGFSRQAVNPPFVNGKDEMKNCDSS